MRPLADAVPPLSTHAHTFKTSPHALHAPAAAQVSRSVEYVQSGTSALQDAKQLQKSTRKWMCCGIITLLIIAVIIVLVVVKPWELAAKKNGR